MTTLTPKTPAELAEIVQHAHETNAVIVPQGGGTHQSIGNPIAANDREIITINMRGLNRVIEYEPNDMVIGVEAGMTFAELDAIVRPNGQMLPLDVPLPERCTIGGALAVAADGPRRLGYGTLRDLILGAHVVEASGRISKAGGMTVKNVSGYDMMKLYHGSYGTLSIITRANFKLLPRPRAAATLRMGFDSLAAAFKLVDALQASQFTPAAVELICDAKHNGVSLTTQIEVAVLTDGLPDAVARHERDIPALAKGLGSTTWTVLHGNQHDTFWAYVADLNQVADLQPDKLALKLACLPSQLGDALALAQKLAAQHALTLTLNARAINGVAYLRARGANANLQAFHTALLAQHPRLVVTGAPEALRGKLAIWGNDVRGRDIMQRIKHEFDPQRLLNPGRFVV